MKIQTGTSFPHSLHHECLAWRRKVGLCGRLISRYMIQMTRLRDSSAMTLSVEVEGQRVVTLADIMISRPFISA